MQRLISGGSLVLNGSERHGGVIRPFTRLQAKRPASDHVGQGRETSVLRQIGMTGFHYQMQLASPKTRGLDRCPTSSNCLIGLIYDLRFMICEI